MRNGLASLETEFEALVPHGHTALVGVGEEPGVSRVWVALTVE